MKSKLNKIILYFVTIFFLSSCHTLEHQNIFLETVKKNQKQEILKIEEKDTKTKSKKIENKKSSNKDDMAPIKVPNQKQKVKTIPLIKKNNIPKPKKIDLGHHYIHQGIIKKIGMPSHQDLMSNFISYGLLKIVSQSTK